MIALVSSIVLVVLAALCVVTICLLGAIAVALRLGWHNAVRIDLQVLRRVLFVLKQAHEDAGVVELLFLQTEAYAA